MQLRWSSTDASGCIGGDKNNNGSFETNDDKFGTDAVDAPPLSDSNKYWIECESIDGNTDDEDELWIYNATTPVIETVGSLDLVQSGDSVRVRWDPKGNRSCTVKEPSGFIRNNTNTTENAYMRFYNYASTAIITCTKPTQISTDFTMKIIPNFSEGGG